MADNITIYDGIGYQGGGQGGEDNETEPGNVLSQAWDLEGFFLNGFELSMVGGYNFKDGERSEAWDQTFYSGDIFISTDSNFSSGEAGDINAPYQIVTTNFGYEYAIDLDFLTNTYNIIELNSSSTVRLSYFEQNSSSNPYRYLDGGTVIGNGDFTYSVIEASDVAAFGFSDSDTHNLVSGIDLSFLKNDQEFWAHFTMGCGNDNLMGNGTTPVPEPATMLLLGTGLIGLAGASRKKFKK